MNARRTGSRGHYARRRTPQARRTPDRRDRIPGRSLRSCSLHGTWRRARAHSARDATWPRADAFVLAAAPARAASRRAPVASRRSARTRTPCVRACDLAPQNPDRAPRRGARDPPIARRRRSRPLPRLSRSSTRTPLCSAPTPPQARRPDSASPRPGSLLPRGRRAGGSRRCRYTRGIAVRAIKLAAGSCKGAADRARGRHAFARAMAVPPSRRSRAAFSAFELWCRAHPPTLVASASVSQWPLSGVRASSAGGRDAVSSGGRVSTPRRSRLFSKI